MQFRPHRGNKQPEFLVKDFELVNNKFSFLLSEYMKIPLCPWMEFNNEKVRE
jgi:hypothetical protein